MKGAKLSRPANLIRFQGSASKPEQLRQPWRRKASESDPFKFTCWDNWDPKNPDHAHSRYYTHQLMLLELHNRRVHKLEMQLADPMCKNFRTAVYKELSFARHRRAYRRFTFLLARVVDGLFLISTVLRKTPVNIFNVLRLKQVDAASFYELNYEFRVARTPVLKLSKHLMIWRPMSLAWQWDYARVHAYALFEPCLQHCELINRFVDKEIEAEVILKKRHNKECNYVQRTPPFRGLILDGTVAKLHKRVHTLGRISAVLEALIYNRERRANPRLMIMDSIFVPMGEMVKGLVSVRKALQGLIDHQKIAAFRHKYAGFTQIRPMYSEFDRLYVVIGTGNDFILEDMDDLIYTVGERVSKIEPGRELDFQVDRANVLVNKFKRHNAENFRNHLVFLSQLRPWQRSEPRTYNSSPLVDVRPWSSHGSMAKITHHNSEKIGWSPPIKQILWKWSTSYIYSPRWQVARF